MLSTVASGSSALGSSASGSSAWRSSLRRLAVAVLASVLVVSVLAAAPGAAAPGGCDADGDGNAGGVVAEVFSDGDDQAADDLAADTGVVLGPAEAAQRWRVAVCVEPVGSDGAPARSVLGAPEQEPEPEAALWEAEALAGVLDELAPQYWRPGARTSPHVDGVQFVGLEMWLAVDPDIWVPISTTTTVGEVSVSATAVPATMVWEFSDGLTRVCPGPGLQYSPGAAGPAPCGRDFERTTEVVPVAVAVSIDYAVEWTSTLGNAGTLARRGEANRYELVVGEVQTYLSDGDRPARPPPEELADPASSRPMDDRHCSIGTVGHCSLSDVADALADAGEALVAGSLGALGQVWAFVQGCAAFVGQAFTSIVDLGRQLGELAADPARFMDEKFALAQELYRAIDANAGAFAREFLNDEFQLGMIETDRGRWVGMIGCEVAVAVLTGGAGSVRVAKLLSRDGFLDSLRDFERRHDSDDGTPNDGPGACRSSFPSATLVLAGDGNAVPIEAIEAGDTVAAFDPATGTWAPRAVTAQWSYLDTDEMATLALADGSTVSATDHHRFYNASADAFEELEDLSSGDELVTPTGRVGVESVTLWPSAPTLVWELSVEVDHSFAVFAGDHAVAVHNQDEPGCVPTPGAPPSVLPTPQVGSTKLQNIVNDLYKGTMNPGRVGTGTTADALRYELSTGQRVFGKSHLRTAQSSLRGLENWLKANPNAPNHDRLVDRSLADDLLDALGRTP